MWFKIRLHFCLQAFSSRDDACHLPICINKYKHVQWSLRSFESIGFLYTLHALIVFCCATVLKRQFSSSWQVQVCVRSWRVGQDDSEILSFSGIDDKAIVIQNPVV